MTTNPREPALYRGEALDAARAALETWQPELGVHDPAAALRLARGLAGAAGRTLFITDTRAKVPPDQRAIGVGHPIENVGFAGAVVSREGATLTWRALIKNHATTPQRRQWHVVAEGVASPPQALEIAPGMLTEISAQFPATVERVTVALSGDAFALDDRLPLVAPRPKPIAVSVEGTDEAAEFFRRLVTAVDGVTFAAAGALARLRLARLDPAKVAGETRGGIFWPPADQRAQAPLLGDPVTPERDPLVDGLNWQGWLGTGPTGFAAAPHDSTLLWHGRWPLVFVREPARADGLAAEPARKLMLAFDWATSNASRLPAMVLLIRRFVEAERDAQPLAYAANFDCSAPVAVRGVPLDGAFTMTFEPAGEPGRPPQRELIPVTPRAGIRAPARPGFFTLRRDDEVLVQGSAQFSDTRQGDFSAAERFVHEVRGEREAALERNTTSDPFVVGWLVLLGALLLASWWPGKAASMREASARPSRAPALP
jgi:hypothetical protein